MLFHSGTVNIYEFVSVFRDFSVQVLPKFQDFFDQIEDGYENNHGHLLSLSTVECAERIIHIYDGNGAGTY